MAIAAAREALKVTPNDDPGRLKYLNKFGTTSAMRFDKTGITDDWNAGVSADKTILDSLPEGHSERSRYPPHLAWKYQIRFKHSGSIEYLNQAIALFNDTVTLTPETDSARALHLMLLGVAVQERLKATCSLIDRDRAIDLYEEFVNLNSAPPRFRIDAAIRANFLLKKARDQSSVSNRSNRMLKEKAVSLLPLACPRSMNRTDQQMILSLFNGLSSAAAATSLLSGENEQDALEILEQGRGILISIQLETRSDITAVEEKYPSIAIEFKRLREEVDVHFDSSKPFLHQFLQLIPLYVLESMKLLYPNSTRCLQESVRSLDFKDIYWVLRQKN